LFVEEIAEDDKAVLATKFAKIEFVEFCVLKFV
jgi:hypothetical protein